MGLRPLSDDDVRDKLMRCITMRYADSFAEKLTGKGFLSGKRYIPYFAMRAVTDEKPTLRLAYVASTDRVVGKVEVYEYLGVKRLLSNSAKLEGLVKKGRAKRVVISYTCPERYAALRDALEDLEKIFESVKNSEVYDVVLIYERKMYSVIRSYKEKG